MSDLKCLHCGSTELLAEVVVTKLFGLAKRRGSIRLAGQVINQIETKAAWDEEIGDEHGEKAIKGDIICADCTTRHHYVTAQDELFIGSVHGHPDRQAD